MVADATIMFRGESMGNKKKFVWNRDRYFSIGMIVFALAVIYFTGQIKPRFQVGSGSDPGSKVFPYAVAILLILSSIGKFITCNKPDTQGWVEGKKGWLKILLVLMVLLLYVLLLKPIGFIICSFLGTLALLMIMRGDRKIRPLTYILYPGILTAALYLLFSKVLLVLLPMGTFWKTIF